MAGSAGGITPISGLPPVQPVRPAAPVQQPGEVAGKDFKSILLDNLEEVNRLQQEADLGVQRLIAGETDNVAEVFATVNKAGIAFDLLMEIRNKLMDAYRDIQQMRG